MVMSYRKALFNRTVVARPPPTIYNFSSSFHFVSLPYPLTMGMTMFLSYFSLSDPATTTLGNQIQETRLRGKGLTGFKESCVENMNLPIDPSWHPVEVHPCHMYIPISGAHSNP